MQDRNIDSRSPLPPGQFELKEFPRFGLGKFARFHVAEVPNSTIEIRGDVAKNTAFDIQAGLLPRVTDQVADFHCVTTWSVRDLVWSGVRFLDFYRDFVTPQALPWMDHPRARVAFEERGNRVPAWLLRNIYRLLIPSTIRRFRRTLELHVSTVEQDTTREDF